MDLISPPLSMLLYSFEKMLLQLFRSHKFGAKIQSWCASKYPVVIGKPLFKCLKGVSEQKVPLIFEFFSF